MTSELPRLEDDGLLTPEVGSWAEEKYRLIAAYSEMFATGMKNKWQTRVYVDLFSGSGRVRIKDTTQILSGSPLIALSIKDRFDRYVLCEEDGNRLSALKERVNRVGAADITTFVPGNVNEKVRDVLTAIPYGSKDNKVLTFCFVDPYKMDNLAFSTIRELSSRYIDFLILIPSFMDANRNIQSYKEIENKTVDNYLGLSDWRSAWEEIKAPSEKFGVFVLDAYRAQMAKMEFKYEPVGNIVEVRSDQKNLPLYHLAFFSRHPRGQEFWKKAKSSSDPQKRLF